MKKIFLLTIAFGLLFGVPAQAKWWQIFGKKTKSEKVTKPKTTNYEKLFKDKTVESDSSGLMTIHKVEDKVYVEFPLEYVGRDMMLTAIIESISDAGEGYPGQIGGRAVRLQFTKPDTATLEARMSLLTPHMNSSEDSGISAALRNATIPGVFKSFKILAFNRDSSAVVVDMKELFYESSTYTSPFPATASNAYYGFVSRSHKFQKERSRILNVTATHNSVGLRSEMSFLVDHTLMGAYSMYEDVPLTAVINKILVMLPKVPMKPHPADSRVGVLPIRKTDFVSEREGVKNIYYARKWDLQPADSNAVQQGKLSDVTKPIVFYMDTLVPAPWRQYLMEGILEWNKAFEKIGFSNVLNVKMFPAGDSTFNANSFDYNTIRFVPTWLNAPQVTTLSDNRTGEILNTSIGIGANLISVAESDLMASTMAADPRVRCKELPIDLLGDMIRLNMFKAGGECLGLTLNRGASSAYPVDSLRSATFTQKYGISGSVMEDLISNTVAREQDVKNGVALMNKTLGAYDYDVIEWLYTPLTSDKFSEQEQQLDAIVKKMKARPYSVFVKDQPAVAYDPRTAFGGLGDDNFKSAQYTIENVKKSLANYDKWYGEDDKDYRVRSRQHSNLVDLYTSQLSIVLSYVGGIYIHDIREGDGAGYTPVAKAKQKQALKFVTDQMKDLSWIAESGLERESPIENSRLEKVQLSLFNSIFGRLNGVEICSSKSTDPYNSEEFLNDVYNFVWAKTISGKPLTNIEKVIQTAFLASIIDVSTVTGRKGGFGVSSPIAAVSSMPQSIEEISAYPSIGRISVDGTHVASQYYAMVLRAKKLIQSAEKVSSGELKAHYQILLYRLNKALDI